MLISRNMQHRPLRARLAPISLLAPLLATMAGCSSSAAVTPVADAGTPLVDAPSSCPTPTGAGTTHDGTTIEADTTWTAEGSPHLVTFTPIIAATATLTIAPCAEVRFVAGYGLQVRGKLVAKGTATQPIAFKPADAAKPFGALYLDGGTADLAYATLTGGGATGGQSLGVIDLRGSSDLPRREALTVTEVTIDGSVQYGVVARENAGFAAASSNLTVRGAALGPFRATARLAGTLPVGSYTGNGVDEILVLANDEMSEDSRWPLRGVPYRLGATNGDGHALQIGKSLKDAPPVTWTVDPGVTIRVSPSGSVLMNAARTTASPTVDVSNGTLIAVGTAAAPIVFEGVTQTPGSWRGLVFRAAPTPASRLDYVTVAHAGGASQANSFHCAPMGLGAYSTTEDAALALFGPPSSAFVTHSTFRASAADGIDHAYSAAMVDLLATNLFDAIAGCKQTRPRNSDGTCPQAGYCP
jgi:hypothetical protein